jgi:hypothetical protein
MSFFEGISRSWKLVKLSWAVLLKDKELLLFPVMSAIGAIVMLVLLLTPAGFFEGLSTPAFILWYFVASFIVIFHNAAIVACVRKRLHGGDPTVAYGYGEAFKRIMPILVWSAISATVGLILRQLEKMAEDNFIAQIVVGLIGMAWTITTFFVIPFIIVEGVSATGAISRSASLVKKTWGEQVVATASISLGFLLFWILGFLVGFAAWFTGTISLVLIVILLLYFAMLAVVQSALSAILTGVIYSYATGDNIPLEFKQVAGEIFANKNRV